MTEPLTDERLAELEHEWLQQCGPCDGGLPMACACATGDPRVVISQLATELRAQWRSHADTANAWTRAELRIGELEEKLAKVRAREDRVRTVADDLDEWHDSSLVTSDYPMIAKRIRRALDGGEPHA